MSVTLEQQLVHRPIDPTELEETVQEVQRQARALIQSPSLMRVKSKKLSGVTTSKVASG